MSNIRNGPVRFTDGHRRFTTEFAAYTNSEYARDLPHSEVQDYEMNIRHGGDVEYQTERLAFIQRATAIQAYESSL
ncbi:MAG TPA: hypothetical protein VFV52_17135 [Bacilli bacterium]|nr:hypothetical protein [Bacilli bacterium]